MGRRKNASRSARSVHHRERRTSDDQLYQPASSSEDDLPHRISPRRQHPVTTTNLMWNVAHEDDKENKANTSPRKSTLTQVKDFLNNKPIKLVLEQRDDSLLLPAGYEKDHRYGGRLIESEADITSSIPTVADRRKFIAAQNQVPSQLYFWLPHYFIFALRCLN